MGARRKGRELALQMLYQWDVGRQPLSQIFDSIAELRSAGEEARSFALSLAEGAVRHREEIDARIEENSRNWRLSRMPVVDRNILRLAVFEYLVAGTPGKVVINEALEIAKRYSSPEAVEFLNGVLDAICMSGAAAPEKK